MSDFEYTITPRESTDGRRWEWEGGLVSFETSDGCEILDLTQEVYRWRALKDGSGADC